MAKASAISSHPQQQAIDAAIMVGEETLQALAVRFNVSAHSLSRRKKSLATAPAVENGDDLQARSDLLWERSNLVWEQSLADADVRGQVAAVMSGLRSLELSRKQAERAAEAAPPESAAGQVSLEAIDRLVVQFDQLCAASDMRTHHVALEESKRLQLPDCYDLFMKMWDNVELKQAVLHFARDWVATEEGSPEG